MTSNHAPPSYNCSACSYTYSVGDYEIELDRRCRRCNSSLDVVTTRFDNWNAAVSDRSWVGRYSSLLPVSSDLIPDIDNSALQPVAARKLAELLGVEEVNLIPQSANPTGTFKDVEGVVVAAKAAEWHLEHASVHSTGNTALSYRHFFELAGVPCAVFIPTTCSMKLTGIKSTPDYSIYGFTGPFPKLSAIARKIADESGYVHLAPLHWKLEGKMTIAFAIAEMIPQTNIIVQTIAGGYGPIGYQLGLERAQRSGLNVPKISYGLFQSHDASTIADAVASRMGDLDAANLRLPDDPFEITLQSTNPLSTYPQVLGLMGTHSYIDSVTSEDVLIYASEFTDACKDVGVPIDFAREKSPYISWAGLRLRASQGKLSRSDRVAFVVTGSCSFPHKSKVNFDFLVSEG